MQNKCKNCNKGLIDILDVKIVDKNNTYHFCPNCLAIEAQCDLANKIQNNDNFICDVTGKNEAICYECSNEKYFLEKEVLIRLINNSLTPEEYFILAKKYNPHNFMLHDDFYDPVTGIAIQPRELD